MTAFGSVKKEEKCQSLRKHLVHHQMLEDCVTKMQSHPALNPIQKVNCMQILSSNTHMYMLCTIVCCLGTL